MKCKHKNLLFLKKKKQKDFFLSVSACGTATTDKSFLVLFFKKEQFFLYIA